MCAQRSFELDARLPGAPNWGQYCCQFLGLRTPGPQKFCELKPQMLGPGDLKLGICRGGSFLHISTAIKVNKMSDLSLLSGRVWEFSFLFTEYRLR